MTGTDRIAQLNEYIKQSPNDCFLHHALALEYVKLGNEAAARQEFEHNLQADAGYIATYYHLGKLLERTGQQPTALTIYEQGMERAKAAKDMHTYNELQAAYEDLAY